MFIFDRKHSLFEKDIAPVDSLLTEIVSKNRFLVVGGAGTIGQAVVKEIFSRGAAALHVVDLSENNLVELVRDLRSSFGYKTSDFRTFCIDINSNAMHALFNHFGPYEYVLNLAALKHVRSERDPLTLSRMLEVNVLGAKKCLDLAISNKAKTYFAVSTDKASSPVNLMGASKRIMEICLFDKKDQIEISSARFANVAFSDGSLLCGFRQRFLKRQPITAPLDIKRYFISDKEAAELCLLSCLLGKSGEVFYPITGVDLEPINLADIAVSFLSQQGFEAVRCSSEKIARQSAAELIEQNKWPCFFFESDTTGEKEVEEFHNSTDQVDLSRFKSIGVINKGMSGSHVNIEKFEDTLRNFLENGEFSKNNLLQLIQTTLSDFTHLETGHHLDNRM